MRSKINKFLSSNKVAFIFSLLVSFCIWVRLSTSSSESVTRTITGIPITLNLSDSAKEAGLQVFGLDGISAEVAVTGNRIVLGQLTKDNITVFAQQAAGMINRTGNYTLELSARKTGRPQNYEITNQVSPRFINVFVDRFQSKTFEVASNINCSTDSNHFVSVAVLSEPSVTISGPESVVSSINKVVVEKEIKDKITNTTNLKDLPLSLYDENDKKVSSANLSFSTNKLDATINVLSRKTVNLDAIFLNKPHKLNLKGKRLALDQTKIEIAASDDVLDSVNSIPLETLDFADINLYNKEFSLPLKLPSGVRNLSNIYSVLLKFNTDGMQSKNVRVSNIVFVNKPSGQIVNSYTKVINTEVIGPTFDLKNVKSEDLYVQVDLSGKENFKGVTDVPAVIKFYADTSCWVYGRYNVTVQIE